MIAIFPHKKVSTGFVYGDLEAINPTKTYLEIKAIREKNWDAFKSLVNSRKAGGDQVVLKGGRLEVFFPLSESIAVNSGQFANLYASESLDLVVYPFVNRGVEEFVFNVTNGGDFKMENITAKAPERASKYETFTATLKKGGNTKLIELTSSIRPGFWDDLQVGDKVYYVWTYTVGIKEGVVASFNEGLNQITLVSNIDAAVSANTAGNAATYFKESIPLSEYNTYGDFWVPLVSGSAVPCINFVRVTSVGSTPNSFTMKNSSIANFHLGIFGNNNQLSVLFEGDCYISGTAIGFALYGSDVVPSDSIITNTGVLTIEGNAVITVGSYAANDILYGSGIYVHPNIPVNSTGEVHVINNFSEGWIQYSASGEKPVVDGAQSYFAHFNGSGNYERDILTSNSMPTIIDNFITHHNLIGGNTIINGGDIYALDSNISNQPDSTHDRLDIVVNNANLRGKTSMSWGNGRQQKLHLTYNYCDFYPLLFSELNDLIISDSGYFMENLTLNSCTVHNPGLGAVATSKLIRVDFIQDIVIDNLTHESQGNVVLDTLWGGPPVGQTIRINNNCNIDVALRVGADVMPLTSILDQGDGSDVSFSGNTPFFKASPFDIDAAGVTTTSSGITGTAYSVLFGSAPGNGVAIIATGEII